YSFQIANPGPRPRTLVVRLANLGVETAAFTVAERSLQPLAFAAPPVPPVPPTPAGQPAPLPPRPVLEKLAGPMKWEVLEGEGKKVVQRITVPVTLLDPSRYLTVTDVVFRPSASGRPNQLSARIVPETPLGETACPVEMMLPLEMNPDL